MVRPRGDWRHERDCGLKYLFVHQNFPGQYLHIVRHLLRDPGNDIVFISEPNPNALRGVRRVSYQMPPSRTEGVFPAIADFDWALRRAEIVANTARTLRDLAFEPDIIIGHHGWGELLDLPDVWPRAPILGYFEFYYRSDGPDVQYDPEFPTPPENYSRIRLMNAVNHQALALDQHGQTPTRFQQGLYPGWAQPQIRLLREGAQLDTCVPDPKARGREFRLGEFTVAPTEKLVTYVARNLEPYRGFHVMMRALPRLLRERPDAKVVMVGGDDVSYGAKLQGATWREVLQRELAGKYDANRVLFAGQLPYADYVRLLQRSDVHVYLTYPFVASWSLREALACGCAVVGADVAPVQEFITDGENGLLAPGLDAERVAGRILEVLGDRVLAQRLRAGARRYARGALDMALHTAAYEERVAELTGREPPRLEKVGRRRKAG
jgi:glycosyltransferase involved in cell wall biosynthesis